MLKIIIKTIPHAQQNYDTVGDYFLSPDGWLMINISDLGDWKEEILVAIHEIEEYALIKSRGIPIEDIDRWDMGYVGEGEPGDDKDSPYHREHVFATKHEKELAHELEVDWELYEQHVGALE